jgi:hypothetical protein
LIATDAAMAHLEVITELHDEMGRGLKEQVLDLLARRQVLTRTRLQDSLAVKNERLGEMLELLERTGQVSRMSGGWQRVCWLSEEDRCIPHRKENGTVLPPRAWV